MTPEEKTLEALLFTAAEPVSEERILEIVPAIDDLGAALTTLTTAYEGTGIRLVRTLTGWALRTEPEAADLVGDFVEPPRRLTRAAVETLATILCHQPITKSEIERIRGVQLSPGVMDQILAAGFVRPGPRRESPGRPLTWMTTPAFLEAHDLMAPEDLVALRRMRESGLDTIPSARPMIEDEAAQGAEAE